MNFMHKSILAFMWNLEKKVCLILSSQKSCPYQVFRDMEEKYLMKEYFSFISYTYIWLDNATLLVWLIKFRLEHFEVSIEFILVCALYGCLSNSCLCLNLSQNSLNLVWFLVKWHKSEFNLNFACWVFY